MADFETIELIKKDGVAILRLNRPDAANGINLALAKELFQAALECEKDAGVRAVLLTGNGRFFSAGGDVKSFSPALCPDPSAMLRELTTVLHSAISILARMDAPVVVAVNGVCAGAGFSLAVSGDYVISSDAATFTMAYTQVGLCPDGSSSYYLPRLIGMRKTQELMLTNRTLSAEEALQWGAINQVVAADQLEAEAMKLAGKLAKGPTKSFGMVKKLLQATFNNGLETQLEMESAGISGLGNTEDGAEGITAFLERRAPEFKGR